jgi:hypothetical protein
LLRLHASCSGRTSDAPQPRPGVPDRLPVRRRASAAQHVTGRRRVVVAARVKGRRARRLVYTEEEGEAEEEEQDQDEELEGDETDLSGYESIVVEENDPPGHKSGAAVRGCAVLPCLPGPCPAGEEATSWRVGCAGRLCGYHWAAQCGQEHAAQRAAGPEALHRHGQGADDAASNPEHPV